MPATPQTQPKTPNEWTQADAIALREFIMGNPKLMRALRARRPKITGETMEERAVTGSDVNGYFQCLEELENLMGDPAAGEEDAGYVSA